MKVLSRVDEETLTTVKHIYNARQKLKTEAMCGRSVMQQLMKVIVDNNYLQWHREEVGTNVIQNAFFGDSWYSSNWKKFSCRLCLVEKRKGNKLPMGLECVKQLFDPEKLPGVIVTDRELALINVVRQIFPNSAHLLCTRHIGKNVDNYVGKLTKNEDIVKAFRSRWYKLVDAPSVASYEQRLKEMNEAFKSMPAVLDYVKSTWLDPYSDRFVNAFTMNILHLGTRTTNRVESAHAALKSWLKTSTGSLDTIWPIIHSFLEAQKREIKASFQRSQNRDPHVTVLRLFMLLKGRVSHKAIRLLDNEYKRANEVGVDGFVCGCYLRHTMDFRVLMKIDGMEERNQVFNLRISTLFGGLLNLEVCSTYNLDEESHFQIRHDIDKELQVYFKDILDLPEQKQTCSKNSKTERGGCASTSTSAKGRGRGRGRSSLTLSNASQIIPPNILPFHDQLPSYIVPYISSIHNVGADGNCGYRAVSRWIYEDEERWPTVREELAMEIETRLNIYSDILGGHDNVRSTLISLQHYVGSATKDYWMSLLDMGFVISTRYNVVEMKEGFPMPPIYPYWRHHHDPSVAGWSIPYHSRFERWKVIAGVRDQQNNVDLFELDP
ncbi:uncharacterized protein LOC104894833 [Beta vulgaris subsp. vulgaris]|uniref:uncharacterized protein LOC104894833 n=1 Tax=Beta vulgaris subsp. vulgaris TaxID=3555 RepID=UPI0025465C86|nr:uncharacterized protein LOC104894833 [Beta vulgaris subsp. vulgaris]